MKAVGYVKEVNLYPVKSMQGVSVPEATLYWYGLNGDRKYAFVRTDTNSSFPWLTGRELPLNCFSTNLILFLQMSPVKSDKSRWHALLDKCYLLVPLSSNEPHDNDLWR